MKLRGRTGAAVVLAALALSACSRSSPSTLRPAGSEARRLASVWWLMFGMAAVVYVIVAGFIVVASFRGRGTEAGKPSGISDARFVWVGGVIVPVLILAVLAVVTVTATAELRQPEANALHIEVEGADWWWAVRYPAENIMTADEIHVPVGRPLEIGLTSHDVIHSFWVPQLAGKVDLVPGQRNILRVTAEKAGVYQGECAEFCGLQHARMRFLLVAEDTGTFGRWVAQHQAPRGEPVSEEAAQGRRVFETQSCAGCHAIRGTSATGTIGPDLSDIGSRRTLGAGTIVNNHGNLAGWIANSQAIKPGNLMPPIALEPAELTAVLAYLQSLR
jgi:cytochrome c oxidase subunit 2